MAEMPVGQFSGYAEDTINADAQTLIQSIDMDMEVRRKSNDSNGTVAEEYRWVVRVVLYTELRAVNSLDTIQNVVSTSTGLRGKLNGGEDIEIKCDGTFSDFLLTNQRMTVMGAPGSAVVGHEQTWVASQEAYTDALWNT